jgi:hypothetical protein
MILRILETCGLVLDRGVVFQRQFSLNIQNVHHLLNLCWRVSLTFAGFLEFVVVLSTLIFLFWNVVFSYLGLICFVE